METGTSLLSTISDHGTIETIVTDDIAIVDITSETCDARLRLDHEVAAVLAIQLIAHIPESEWPELLEQARGMSK